MTRRSVERGPYAKTHQRRKQISSAALEVLLEDGPDSLSATNIAKRTGLTRATVNYHFPTRDLLILAALSEADAGDKILTNLSELDLAQAISILEKVILAPSGGRNRLQAFTAQSANACDPSHPAHEWVQRHHSLVRDGFAEMLRKLQETGEAHPDVDPERFGRQMVAIWEGMQIQWLIDPSFNLANEVTAAFWTLTRTEITTGRNEVAFLSKEI